jgi:hypothetical protein
MSVYSGFGTRQQETFYNKMIEKSLYLLSKWLLQFFNNGEWASTLMDLELVLDEREWAKKIKKIYKFMSVMDQQKHLPPKFSHAIDGLYVYLSE